MKDMLMGLARGQTRVNVGHQHFLCPSNLPSWQMSHRYANAGLFLLARPRLQLEVRSMVLMLLPGLRNALGSNCSILHCLNGLKLTFPLFYMTSINDDVNLGRLSSNINRNISTIA
jgi:hypothetical protein